MQTIFTGRNEVVAKVMFLQASVILSTGGGVSDSVHVGIPPPGADPPRSRHPPQEADPPKKQTSPTISRHPPRSRPSPRSRHPPKKQTPPMKQIPPRSRHPPKNQTPPQKQTPPEADTPPRTRHPPHEADIGARSMSGRYASYWNAFLLLVMFVVTKLVVSGTQCNHNRVLCGHSIGRSLSSEVKKFDDTSGFAYHSCCSF